MKPEHAELRMNPESRPPRAAPPEPTRERSLTARRRRRRWLSFGASMTEALVTTGAVALAAAAGYQAFGSTINQKITCYGQQVASDAAGTDCGSGASSAIPPVPADAAQGAQAAQTSTGPSAAAGPQGFGASQTTAAVAAPAATSTKLPGDELKTITAYLANPKNDAGKGHAIEDTSKRPSGWDGMSQDGRNALLNAIAYANTKDPKYAKAAAAILADWATKSKRWAGHNGWLDPSWWVGAMTRAAQILKDSGAPQWNAVLPGTKQTLGQAYTSWARAMASRYLFPPNATYQDIWNLAATKNPDRVNRWELQNVSNRTMTALQTSMLIARLSGDSAWFDRDAQIYKRFVEPRKDGTSFFTDANGTNSDDSRKDKATWHHQAGIAAAVGIAQMASTMTDPNTGKPYDLWSLQNNILLKSAQHYSKEVVDHVNDRGVDTMAYYIPYYQTVLQRYPPSQYPKDTNYVAQAYQNSQHWAGLSKYMDMGWGFPQYP